MSSTLSPEIGHYVRVAVRDLPREREDEFSAFCFEFGADGVAEKLQYAQPDVVYDPEIIETSTLEADVYFATRPPEEFLLRLAAAFPEVKALAGEEPNKDWLEEWKKGFEPFLFVEPFWIVPSWREKPAEAREAIWVDPGMAFGTGTHETTKLAAQILVEELNSRGSSASVLDVGTGTGVLAIAAKRIAMGASERRVVAIDNDPEALRVARENAEKNGVAGAIEIPSTQLDELSETFDVVIANIIDGVLVRLQPGLSKALKTGGAMVLSGVLREREREFVEAFVPPSGLSVRKRIEMGEWVAFLLG